MCLYLVGGFVNYIDVGNVVDIGFVVSVVEEKIVKVGNAVFEGVSIMLLNGGM